MSDKVDNSQTKQPRKEKSKQKISLSYQFEEDKDKPTPLLDKSNSKSSNREKKEGTFGKRKKKGNSRNLQSSSSSSSSEDEKKGNKKTRKFNKYVLEEKERSIKIGKRKKEYGNNKITTSKYTLLNFIPLNLFEQFARPANMYFVFISILQCIPDVSITERRPIILIPLFFLCVLIAIKDIAEDWGKQAADSEENNGKAEVLRKKRPRRVLWQNIYPGDIVILKNGDTVPADLLVIFTSDVETGRCFVETKNLNGEINLKTKRVVTDGEQFDTALDHVNYLRERRIVFDRENPTMDRFFGRVNFPSGTIDVSIDNVLLRGSSLQNTDYIYGVALYTGLVNK